MQRYKTKRPRIYRCKLCTRPAKQTINFDAVRVCLECFSVISQNQILAKAKNDNIKFWQLDIFGGQTPAT